MAWHYDSAVPSEALGGYGALRLGQMSVADSVTVAAADTGLLEYEGRSDQWAWSRRSRCGPTHFHAMGAGVNPRAGALKLPADSYSDEGNSPGKTNSAGLGGLGGPVGTAKPWSSAISASKIWVASSA